MAAKKRHEDLGWGNRPEKKVRHQESEDIEVGGENFISVNDMGPRKALQPSWGLCLFLLPHTLIGVCLPFIFLAVFMTNYFGTDTVGTVTALKSARKSQSVHFDFPVGNQQVHRTDAIPYKYYLTLHVGDTVQVRYWSLLPSETATVMHPKRQDMTWALFVFMAIWDSIILPLAYFVYVKPILIRLNLIALK